MLSLQTRRELVARWRAEYVVASRLEKGRILNSVCDATEWNRKYAIGALAKQPVASPKQKRKRKQTYGPNEEAALVKVWRLSDYLASKRLAPFLEEFVTSLERHSELSLPETTRAKLVVMSASTIDRLLKKHRSSHPRSLSMTRPGSLLKKHVAVRMGNGWNDDRPGYFEIDSVAHSGGSTEGEFFWTLSLIDVCTGWYEGAPLRTKGQAETLRQLKSVRARLPFKILGLDSDNGSEFLNWHLVKFCEENGIQFTRCRPYHKNDQCRVEQKNASVVRRHTGYARYDSENQFKLLIKIHGLLRLLVNFFEPSLKGKQKAMTPYRRLLATGTLDEEQRNKLQEIYAGLNPVSLRRELNKTKAELYELGNLVSFLDDASE